MSGESDATSQQGNERTRPGLPHHRLRRNARPVSSLFRDIVGPRSGPLSCGRQNAAPISTVASEEANERSDCLGLLCEQLRVIEIEK
jgi:hypothetical protein